MLKKKIPWSSISIEQVYTANETTFARQIIKTFPIHIILCDIEMPGESGIEFLRWVKEETDIPVITLLLTCHDDFSYAKEGIQLGVMDYILKPIAFENLTQILEKAVKEYQLKHAQKCHIQAGQLWEKHKPSVIKNFWNDFFTTSHSNYYDSLSDLGFTPDTQYLLFVFHQKDSFCMLDYSDIGLFLEQQIQPIFSYINMEYVLFSPTESYFYLVVWCHHCQETTDVIPFLFKQLQSMLMTLHMNQINLCGCFNDFCKLSDLKKKAHSFLRFLSTLDMQFGMFLTDDSINLSDKFQQVANTHLLEDIADYVHRHLSQEISRSDIAQYVHLNPDYLNRIFKKKTGITLIEYIRLERMNYAKHLLRNTELSISEIALSTGFNTLSHFSNAFRKQFDCTPLDYRNKRH